MLTECSSPGVSSLLSGGLFVDDGVPAFRRRDNQKGGGLATDRALGERLTEGFFAKAPESRISRTTESKSGRSVANRIHNTSEI